MLYSVRMRAAQGGAHEQGGKHISGAERLVARELLRAVSAEMLERALGHSRGEADFINLVIDRIPRKNVRKIPCLPIKTVETTDIDRGRKAALEWLIQGGVSRAAACMGMELLMEPAAGRRGAILLDADSGARMVNGDRREVRVSRMDAENETAYSAWIHNQGYKGVHIREALLLASKVMASEAVAAELCWSDDPEYTAGYVATPERYTRFTQLKAYGSEIGGRVFFVKPGINLAALLHYLQTQPVLISVSGEEKRHEVYE